MRRLVWRNGAAYVAAICGVLWFVGQLFLFSISRKKEEWIAPGRLAKEYGIQFAAVLLVSVLFALIDRPFAADYLFPVWSVAGGMAVLWIGYRVFAGGDEKLKNVTIYSATHMRTRRTYSAPVPLLAKLRLLMWVG